MATFTAGQILTAAEVNAIGNDSGWIAFTALYVNSWADNAYSPAYRLIGNHVEFRGQIGGGTSNTVAFTMPAGYRPTQNRNFANTANAATTGYVAVNATSGAVTPVAGNLPVSLDNVRYAID